MTLGGLPSGIRWQHRQAFRRAGFEPRFYWRIVEPQRPWWRRVLAWIAEGIRGGRA